MKTAVTQTCAMDRNFSLSLLVVGQTSKTKVTSSVSHIWSEISSSSLRYNDLKHVLGYPCGIQCFFIVIYVLQQHNREAVTLKSRVVCRCHRNFLFCYLYCEMWIIPWSKGHVQKPDPMSWSCASLANTILHSDRLHKNLVLAHSALLRAPWKGIQIFSL